MEPTNSNLYQPLTGEEKQKIQENAQEIAGLLSIWASCCPVIRAKRVPPVAVLIATVLPGLPLHTQLLVGKLILFIFAVDDLADERLLSYVEFKRAGKAWQEIALDGQAAHPVEQDGGLSAVLSEIRGELAQFSIFPELCPLWANRLGQLCDAMAGEYDFGLRYKASGETELPALEVYVDGGIHSVGFPFWGTSVLILLDEPPVLEHMDVIGEIILQTGAAIRLYNDVRTYEKEVQEGNVNAVTLFLRALSTGNSALPEAERLAKAQERVLRLADMYAQRCQAHAAAQMTTTGQFELMIRRIVAFHASFYGSRQHNFDYHTISSSDSYSMIQGVL